MKYWKTWCVRGRFTYYFIFVALFSLQILETEKELKWQQELLSNEKIKAEEREEHLLKVQRRSEILEDSLTSKVRSFVFSSYSTILSSDVLSLMC